MPELGDYYIGAEILLLSRDQMARGNVVARSQNTNDNVMHTFHANPILGTRMYHVEFTVGKVKQLTTNIIAESLYAQCDSDGNDYLLLDELVHYQKDIEAISLPG